jgi:YVTN family beta-propeller protein
MSTAFFPGAATVAARSVRVPEVRSIHASLMRVLFAAVLLLAALLNARADNTVGAWDPPANWPLIAVHAVLTPDGRVLTYGTDGNGQQTGFFIYDIWDPTVGGAGVGHVTLPNQTGTDLFCSSQIVLPQSGNIFISGGDNFVSGQTNNTGNNNSNVFTPATNALARGNNLNRARWYSSSTTLFNGETYIQGGAGGDDRPEIRSTDGVFRLLSGVNTTSLQELFPRNFLAPDGRIFGFDNEGFMYYVNTAGNGSISMQGTLPGVTDWTSGAAMFSPGKILQFGGQNTAAYVINITGGGAPVVTPTQSIAANRAWTGATVLADGRVLATGGSQADNQNVGVIKYSEIWNPTTGTWTQGASLVNGRLYHNTALLLPDARVLIAGGGAPAPITNLNAEIYSPPYLLAPNGTPLPRPNIVLAPSTLDVGQSFSVGFSNASSISRVTLVKTGSATHSVNMDQRFIELSFTPSGSMLDVIGPARAGDTPPGYYMLFVIDGQGVPSKAKIMKINVASNPNPTPDVSPVIGGNGGSPFTLACNSGELLVGIYGTSAGTVVNQAGVQCIRMNQSGRWIGSPVNRGITGNASGAAYTRTCPTDYAVSGFRGRSSTVVDQLEIECRALTSQGKVTGLGQFAAPVGGSGGTAQGPYNCGTNNPAYALTGRSGSVIENVGLQCRQANASQTNLPPSVVNPGNLVSTVGVPVDITIGASDPEGLPLTFSASGLPPPLSINASSGRITGTPTTLGNFNTSITVTDSANNTVNASFTWSINPVPFTLNPLPLRAPAVAGSMVTFAASASNGSNVRYKWFFDDGTPETAYSSSSSITHTFANPGVYYVTVTAIDDFSPAQMQTTTQMIHLPLTANRPANSSNIAYETRSGSNNRVWVVNQDNDSVSAFDAVTHARLAEINVGSGPRSVAIAPNGRVWVANKFAATLSIINPDTLSVIQTVAMPFASAPYGIVFAPTGSFAFVSLEAAGSVLKLDATSAAQLGSVGVGANPRHVSISGDGAALYVSRFITPPLPGENTASVQTQTGGGEIVRVAASSMTVLGTTVLQHSNVADSETQGGGLPNYLGATVISPDGQSAWVPSKQDNIRRGTLRNGFNLNFQSTVRAISSRVDLATQQEDFAARLDLDNSSVASAIAFDRYGVYMFVALETSREVAVVDAHGGWPMFRVDVGRAPQALAVSPDGLRLYVNNFMDRTLGVYDLSRLIQLGESNVPTIATLPTVATERLSAQVLNGKRLFYDAFDTRLARDKYLSCATCHNDGNGDGRVWDLTGMGEGLRNTINLRGRAATLGQGFLHWSANFDELQDFEGQIRNLSGGTGLMSDAQFNTGTRNQPLGDPKTGVSADLDALAAYVASLNTFASSPLRNTDGTLTADAVAGKQLFTDLSCAQCHSGTGFTDSGAAVLHNVGTLKPSSGTRLGQPLTGLDTPTLRDVWATPPYLHDGSAATLGDAVRAHSGISISDADLAKLSAYLAQIGADEPAPPRPNDPPTLANPGAQSTAVGAAVDLTLNASDPDGDTLHFSAGNLPPGLNVNPNTGHITGVPTSVTGSPFSVTASVFDGDVTVSVSFSWTITAAPDTTAPSAPTGLSAVASSGTQINLSWEASSDNVGVTGYQIERCQGAGCSTFAPLTAISGTTFSNTGLANGTSYSYRVRATDAAGNLSSYSGVATAATPDTSAPTAPTSLAASATSSSQISLSWGAATDNVGVTGYRLERCQGAGCGTFSQVATPAGTAYTDSGVSPNTSYSYRVRGADAAGNLGAYSNTVSATTPAIPPVTGLMAAYAFNEGTGTTLTDSSGNANTGAITGATWTASGKNGGALQFDGTNDRVSIAGSSSLAVSTAMTLEAWVYPTLAQSGWRTIMQKETDAYVLNASNGGGAGQPSGGGTLGGGFDYVASGTALALNTWSHVALTYDGAMLRLYVNGVQVATAARTGAIQTTTSPLWLGGNNPYGEHFAGRIDDTRVYNRALSQAEIQTDMNTPVAP